MKRLLLAILLALGMVSPVWAGCPTVVDATTKWACTTTVFNDSGGALTSGATVVWDTDDTEYDRNGYPYVTTTTTADHDHPAGVMVTGSCPDQALCEMVYYGWARTNIADTTDDATEDTPVATSSVAGQAGDWAGTTGTCYLGMLLENIHLDTLGTTATLPDLTPMPVFVQPACEE